MKQDVLNFRFENKKYFYVTSKNSLAFELVQKWPNWNNQFFFLYGPSKCGKTTICKIWQKKSKAIFLDKKNGFHWNIKGIDSGGGLILLKDGKEKVLTT